MPGTRVPSSDGLVAVDTEGDEITDIDGDRVIDRLWQVMVKYIRRRDAANRAVFDTLHHSGSDCRQLEGFSTVEEINALFTPGLSGQALAYVMAGLARKAKSS